MLRFYVRAISYFRQDLRLVALLLVLVALSVAIGLLQAWPTAVLVDAVLTTTPRRDWAHRLFLGFLPDNKLAQVIGITLIGMALKVTQDAITMVRAMVNNRIKYNGVARVRGELYGKLQDLDAAYHRARPQGDAIYRLSNDTLGPFGVLDTFIAATVAAVTLAVMVLTMVSRNAPLTAYALSVAPLMIWTNLYFGKTIKARSAESKRADADFTTVTQRAISCVSLIQSFGRQRDASATFGGAVDRSVRAWMRLNWQEQLYPFVVNLIYALGGAIIFGYGGYLVYRDQFLHPVPGGGATCGDLMVFMAYLGGLWDPLRCLTGFAATIQGHNAATERVFEILDEPAAVADAPAARPLPLMPRALELDAVRFAYGPAAPAVLRGVSAQVAPGQMVAFVGPSGTGKSTLLGLLSRVQDPTAGALRLDGHDLRDLRLADVRRHVALVPQDSPVLPASIYENIAFGRPGATPAELRAAARLAGAAEFIEALPEGYDTVLAEGGKNLSGGQRQRLAIARALLTEAPILVLDEPTSALDGTQERLVMQTLADLRGRRTVVIVTHRLETLRACDQIFVMDAGRVVDRGTHAQLAARGAFRAPQPTLKAAGTRAATAPMRTAA